MSIRTRNFHRTNLVHPDMGNTTIFVPAADADRFVASIAENNAGWAVGTALTLLQTRHVGSAHPILFTLANAGIDSTVEIIGINQFGDRVNEEVVLLGSGSLLHWSNHAYKTLISITPTRVQAVPVAHGIQVGWDNAVSHLGLPLQLIDGGELLALISDAGTEQTITATNVGVSTVEVSTTPSIGFCLVLTAMQNFGLRR